MTKEEIKEYHKRYNKQYYAKNKDKILEQQKEYRTANREYQKEYRNTPIGRASYLIMNYNREDKKYNRGEGDLTAKWIAENIFSNPCAHCGESDWRKIGCNRIDNSNPHTKDNVEPCCKECNDRLNSEELSKQVFQYSLDGELVRVWESLAEAGRNGYINQNISHCCNGKRKTSGGYRWSFNPM